MRTKWLLAVPVLACAVGLAGDVCSNLEPTAAPPPPRHEPAPAPTPPPPPPPPAPVPPPPPQKSESERQLLEKGSLRLENVFFDTGKATLRPESEASLREAGEALEKYPDLRIRVEGHTDKRGSAAMNNRLSQARAKAVRGWLLAHYKLRPENYTAKGYGFSRPENTGNSANDLQRNRRVVLTVTNPEALPHNVELEKK
jgi:OOP family OmpA-OmpF porin